MKKRCNTAFLKWLWVVICDKMCVFSTSYLQILQKCHQRSVAWGKITQVAVSFSISSLANSFICSITKKIKKYQTRPQTLETVPFKARWECVDSDNHQLSLIQAEEGGGKEEPWVGWHVQKPHHNHLPPEVTQSPGPPSESVCQMSLSGFEPQVSIYRMLSLDYSGEAKRSL